MSTYTIKLENARQVSTLLDALNTQEVVLYRAMENLTDAGAKGSLQYEVDRVQELRKLLLNTNADKAST